MIKYAVFFFAAVFAFPSFSDDYYIEPQDYGLIVNDGLSDKAALDAAFAEAKVSKRPVRLPSGQIDVPLTSTWDWDFALLAYSGFEIYGAGIGKTRVVLSPSAGMTGPLWRWSSSADWYDVHAEGFSIVSSYDGVMFQLGKDNFQDPLNILTMTRVGLFNSKVGLNNEVFRMNYVVNSRLDSVRANGFANGLGANYGKALHCRQCQFVTHLNFSYGNAAYGGYFSSGFNYANWFINGDVENIVYGFASVGANTGLTEVQGTRISLWEGYGVTASAGTTGSRFNFTRPSLGPKPGKTVFIDPGGAAGVTVVN